MTEKNCKTCVAGEGECGKRNMCVISDHVGKGHGDGNWYMKWKPKNTKFPCGAYCYGLHKGMKTCDECIAEFNSPPERAEVMAELDERNRMLDERGIKLEEGKPGVSFTCDIKGEPKDFHIDLSENSEGTKHDEGKPRLAEMIMDFRKPLLEICKVWEFGADKYAKSNWKKVGNGEDRYTNALARHFAAEMDEVVDAETKLHHAIHVAWNAIARLYFIIKDGE